MNTYNPYLPFQNLQPQFQPNVQNQEIQYVDGLDSAKAYALQPNQSVMLLDLFRSLIFYIKKLLTTIFAYGIICVKLKNK